MSEVDPHVIATRDWVERVVIGLNLCPFAKPVFDAGAVRFTVSEARAPKMLQADLENALLELHAADPANIETTLLIHPWVLTDFIDYNDFLDVADETLNTLDLDGVIQVTSFHPDYQFADSAPDAIENYTNRSPYPMLHLLREASVTRAVASHPDTAAIYARNVATMRQLGMAKLAKLINRR